MNFIRNLTDVEIPQEILHVLSLTPKFSLLFEKREIPIINIIKDAFNSIELRSMSTNILTNYLQTPHRRIYKKKKKRFLQVVSNVAKLE